MLINELVNVDLIIFRANSTYRQHLEVCGLSTAFFYALVVSEISQHLSYDDAILLLNEAL